MKDLTIQGKYPVPDPEHGGNEPGGGGPGAGEGVSPGRYLRDRRWTGAPATEDTLRRLVSLF